MLTLPSWQKYVPTLSILSKECTSMKHWHWHVDTDSNFKKMTVIECNYMCCRVAFNLKCLCYMDVHSFLLWVGLV
jgi:hypothetical protein